ncbi:beta/alpha barrel domain-containing protein [Roseimaritima ulvae]|uniref:Dihydroorotate dehydrogenase 2 n=1 Tax=Roseimaritima ulvae TaxID=980254 RepID=A0A5B9QNZ1_9BACT|nr:hypothetical protein [Roseimaritima ulvae]QEG40738.1 dihydroorotate dehydrogenase 2 [Roseimaritima ulvae]
MSLDVTTHYGGLVLQSPIIVGACPLTAQERPRLAMEAAGAGAVVLPSLFEEQVLLAHAREGTFLSRSERLILEHAKRMQMESFCTDADVYLALVNRASGQMSIPVIASLNGYTATNWVDFAGELQGAGADAIELNLHHPPAGTYNCPREIEDAIVDTVAKINHSISIPVFVNLQREYTSPSHLACRLLSGVQGMVLFGREPDIDICLDSLKLKPCWGLSEPQSVRHSLAAIMQVHSHCPAMPLGVSGGVHTPEDLIRALLAGGDAALLTAALYREGPDVIRTLIDGLIRFMERHHWRSIAELKVNRPLEFDSDEQRSIYMQALTSRFVEEHLHVGQRTMHGDRWGHPES